MGDERVWLRHTEHGGAFHCPAEAVDEWRGMGWEPGDPPAEDNPVVAENLAWQAEQSAERAAAAKAAKKTAKTSRDSGADTNEPQE